MVSSAERKLAAKEKLAALATQRRDAELAEQAQKEAKLAAKAARAAEAAKKATEAATTKEGESNNPAIDAPAKKKQKNTEAGAAPQGVRVTRAASEKIEEAEESAQEQKAEKKKLKKPKLTEEPIIVEGKQKNRAPVDLVPTEVPKLLGAEAYREAHNIVCMNVDCPAVLETFACAEPLLGSHFVQQLKDRGFYAPSPIQAQAWPLALAGSDIVGIAQTGSGKTLAYLLPILVRLRARGKPSTDSYPATPTALVLAPTRELIQQIASETAKLAISIGHRFVPCFGGVWRGDQLKQLGKGCDILLSTPGRLKDFLTGDKAKDQPPAICVTKVSYLVLDEADAMLAMGFMPQVTDIAKRCMQTGLHEQGGAADGPRAGTARQTLFFTATWPLKVKAASKEFASSSAAQLRIGQGVGADKLTANKNVRQIVQMVEYWDKIARLTNVLTSELNKGDTCVVFCGTKGRTEYVVDELNKSRVVDWCEGIHSGKEQWVRDGSLERFRQHTAKSDCRAVLVATDVAARGLDIPGVALVIVYDLNGWNGELNIDSYVHRIGRTGRAGKMGRAFTFVESKDKGLPDLKKLLVDAGQKIPQALSEMEINERAPLEDRAGKKRKRREMSKAERLAQREEGEGPDDDYDEGETIVPKKKVKQPKVKEMNANDDGEGGEAAPEAKVKQPKRWQLRLLAEGGSGKGKDGGENSKDKDGKDKGKGGKDKGKGGKDKGKGGKDKGKGKGKKGKDKGKGKRRGKGDDNDSDLDVVP